MGQSEPRLRVLSARHREDLRTARAAVRGDRGAASRIAHRLLPRVRTTVAYIVGEGPDTLDMVQDIMVEILRSLRNFEGRSTLETWADRIAVRLVMRQIRKRRANQRLETGDADQLASGWPTAENLAQGEFVRRRLAVHLARLSPERRLTFVLHAVYGYTAPEIAEMTGTKVNTVRDRLKHARRQLRELVSQDQALSGILEAEP